MRQVIKTIVIFLATIFGLVYTLSFFIFDSSGSQATPLDGLGGTILMVLAFPLLFFLSLFVAPALFFLLPRIKKNLNKNAAKEDAIEAILFMIIALLLVGAMFYIILNIN